jgi:hypothetical protein
MQGRGGGGQDARGVGGAARVLRHCVQGRKNSGGHGAGPLRAKHHAPRKVKAPPPPSSSSPRTTRSDVQYYYSYFLFICVLL